MAEVSRLQPEVVREGLLAGTTMLVCAYADDAKFQSYNLDGAIPLSSFKEQIANVAKDQRIVFYCA